MRNTFLVFTVAVMVSAGCGRSDYDGVGDEGDSQVDGIDGVDAGNGGVEAVMSLCDGLPADIRVTASDHCYTFHAAPVTFDDALAACVALGGNLAEPTTPEEELALRDTGIELSSGPWIGIQGDGAWRWMSESPLLYSNWPSMPPGETKNRGFIDENSWGVDLVDNTRGFLCEFGWTRHPNGLVEYEAFYEPLRGWASGRDLCATHGGDLAVLTDPASYAAVAKLTASDRWVGAIDSEGNGSYAWLDGAKLDDIRWATNEPTGNSGCVLLKNGSDYVEKVCDSELPVLCQRDVSD